MYELSYPIRIKELPMFYSQHCIAMTQNYLVIATQNGVNIGELTANVFVYEFDDLIFTVEYIKMLCNLSTIFRNIFDNDLYNLRLQGYINDKIYSSINFQTIFNEVNNKFNAFIEEPFLFEEISIYGSEISLETSIALYETFNDNMIILLSKFVDINLLKYTFNKINIKYLQNFYDQIGTQIQNVFSI